MNKRSKTKLLEENNSKSLSTWARQSVRYNRKSTNHKRKKMLLFNVSPECWPSYGVKILPDNSGEAEAGMPSKVKECSGE